MKNGNIVTVMLGLGGLFWCLELCSSRTRAQVSFESCEQKGRFSFSTHDRTFNNGTLILELQQERQRNSQLEIELSKLRGQKQLKKRQRIALMFTGAPRTLTQLGVMTSHVVNVIDALSAGGNDVVDVFFHLNNGTADGAHASNNVDRVPQRPFTRDILDRLINLTSPVDVVLHNDSSCTGLNGQLAKHSCCTSHTSHAWQSNFLQFAFIRDSYRRVQQYEKANNVTYDWFVRMRPDVACFEPVPAARSLSARRFYLITKERHQGTNANDYIFVVPRRLSSSFFEEQIITIFETSCPHGISHWPAEESMLNYRPNLPYQALPFPCVHVLSPTAAECSRLSRHDQPTIPTVYEVDGSAFSEGQNFEEGCKTLVQNGYFGDQSHVDIEEMGIA